MERNSFRHAVFLLIVSSVAYSRNINTASSQPSHTDYQSTVFTDTIELTTRVYPTNTTTTEEVVTANMLQENVTGELSSTSQPEINNLIASKDSNKYFKIVYPIITSTTDDITTGNKLVMDVPEYSTASTKPSYTEEDPVVSPESKVKPKIEVVNTDNQLQMNIPDSLASTKPYATGNDPAVLTDLQSSELVMDIPEGKAPTQPPYTFYDRVTFIELQQTTEHSSLVHSTIKPATEAEVNIDRFLMDVQELDCSLQHCRVDGKCRECG